MSQTLHETIADVIASTENTREAAAVVMEFVTVARANAWDEGHDALDLAAPNPYRDAS